MKQRRRDGSAVRSVLAGMVVDRTVCSRIAGQWTPPGLFDAPWANLVGGWCVEHLREYGEPPNGRLRSLFANWVADADPPKETVEGVEKFLRAADEERERSEQTNSDFVLDQAGRHFNEVRLKQAMERAEELRDVGRVDEARAELTGITRVQLGVGCTIKLGLDYDAVRQAYDEDRKRPLVSYPGMIQGFIGRWFVRDSLFAFMAPDKSGKSVYLMDAAHRAARNRHRVAFFDCGDNSQDQVIRRFGARAALMPSEENYKKRVKVPLTVNGDGEVECEFRTFDSPASPQRAWRAIRRATRGVDRLRVECHPNSSFSVIDLEAKLSEWEMEDGWTPDVLVVDYADILAPPPGVRETLDQIDDTWKRLRRLSQERHCLVLTATQASAAAYSDKAGVLKKQHFSGRKTKLAHVNGMIGINVNDQSRQTGVTWLNWIVRREGRYSENRQVPVAGCWPWYSPIVRVPE